MPQITDTSTLGQLALLATVIVGGIAALQGLRGAARGITRLIHQVGRIDDLMPVALNIAEQFKANGGATLYDRVQRIEHGVADAGTAAAGAAELSRQLHGQTEQMRADQMALSAAMAQLLVAMRDAVATMKAHDKWERSVKSAANPRERRSRKTDTE